MKEGSGSLAVPLFVYRQSQKLSQLTTFLMSVVKLLVVASEFKIEYKKVNT